MGISKNNRLTFILSVIMAAFFSGGVFAQTLWDLTMGGPNYDTGLSVLETENSSILVVGDLQSDQWITDGWLLSISESGDSLWSRTYGGVSQDGFHSIQSTEDDNFLILGYTYAQGNSYPDAWVLKVNPNGDLMWSEVLGGASSDGLYSLVQTTEGNILLCGSTRSYGDGGSDGWLIMMNSEGDTLWTRTYGADLSDYAGSVIQSSDQSYVFLGSTESFNSTTRDIWLVKTELTGEVRWMKVFYGEANEYGREVLEIDSEGYLILSATQTLSNFSTGALIIRTDMQGDTLWTKKYGNNYPTGSSLIAESLISTTDDHFVLLGIIERLGSNLDIQIIKIDSNGEIIWSNIFGGEGRDVAYEIIETSDRGYLIVGSTQSFGSGGSDVWLIKTDSLGNALTQTSIKEVDIQFPELYLAAYPNPFNGRINIEYILPIQTTVSINIFTISGREVYSFTYPNQNAGEHHFQWQYDPVVSSGIYVLHLSAGLYSETKKFTLIK